MNVRELILFEALLIVLGLYNRLYYALNDVKMVFYFNYLWLIDCNDYTCTLNMNCIAAFYLI